MKKRIVSFLLALVMAVSLLPVSAFAEDGDSMEFWAGETKVTARVSDSPIPMYNKRYTIIVPDGTKEISVKGDKLHYVTDNTETLCITVDGKPSTYASGMWEGGSYNAENQRFTFPLNEEDLTSGTYATLNDANDDYLGEVIVKISGKIPPTTKSGTNESVNLYLKEGETFSFDLTEIFIDEDGDPLTFTCSTNGAGGNYSPIEGSTYTGTYDGKSNSLCFKANDGKVDSKEYYLVYLWTKGDTAQLDALIKSAPTDGYYTENDRYNAKTKATSKTSFWAEYQSALTAARAANVSTSTPAKVDSALKNLQAAIGNLIPTTQVNPTALYETLQNYTGVFYENSTSYTPDTWAAFDAARTAGHALLDGLFDENGDATAANTAEKQSEIDAAAAALKEAAENLYNNGTVTANKKTIEQINTFLPDVIALADTVKQSDYTAESWASFAAALTAARNAKTPVLTETKADDAAVAAYKKAYEDLYQQFYYGLTPVGEITTYLDPEMARQGNGTGSRAGAAQQVKLSGDYSLYAAVNSLANKPDRFIIWPYAKIFINGVYVTEWYLKQESFDYQSNKVSERLRLHPGDTVVVDLNLDPQSEFQPTIYGGSAELWQYIDSIKTSQFVQSNGLEVKAGEPFTLTVQQAKAALGRSRAVEAGANMTLFISDMAEAPADNHPTAKQLTQNEKAVITDADGSASVTLYREGWYLIAAYDLREDEKGNIDNSSDGSCPSHAGKYYSANSGTAIWVHVNTPDDLSAVKNTLQSQLDEAYAAYAENYFRPAVWSELKSAYDTGTAGIKDAATSTGASDAQQTAIETIRKLQNDTTAENKQNLTTFRTELNKLPDDTSLLSAGVKSTVDKLIACYEGMSDYQRRQLTGVEQTKYNSIKAFADTHETFPEDKAFKLTVNVVGDTDEVTAALNDMTKYLREHPATQDRGSGGGYGTPIQTEPFCAFTATIPNRTEVTTAAASTKVRFVSGIDYAAYFQTRAAKGTFTVDGAKWSISNKNLQFTTYGYGYTVNGGLTVTIGGEAYEIKSVTYQGIDPGSITSGTMIAYDDTEYLGKDKYYINMRFEDAAQEFTMPYNDVTVTVTWGPVSESMNATRTAALSRLQTLYNSLGDKAKAAYDTGVKAIQAAATAAEVDKAYQSAVVAMKKAADNYGKVQVIVENTTYPVEDGAPWDGELVDEWIDLNADSTMMNCIVAALEKKGFTQTGAENGYIASIEGLSQMDGGGESGWMGTLNDWFTNFGFKEFTVENGSLSNGDVIRIMYSREGLGADLGGTWDNSDTTLAALDIQGGKLASAFTPGEAGGLYEYTLTIEGESADLRLTPTASNKNFLTKIFLNEKVTDRAEGSSFYKRTESIPVKAGDTIYVGCGAREWPTMNNQEGNTQENDGTWYVLRVVNANAGADYVTGLISQLPEAAAVTYASYQKIAGAAAAARSALDALSKDEQDKVNASKLEKVEAAIAQFKAIDDAKTKIDALPEAGKVTLAERDAVKAAQDAYDALSAEQKEYLTFAQAAKVTALAKRIAELEAAPIKSVEALIDAIGTVTLDSKSAIDEARKAYDKLTAAQQAKVSNYAALTAAETTYAKLVQDKTDQDAADAVIAKIDAIGTVTLKSKKAIDEARKAYDKLTAAQQARVSNYATLTAAETTYAKLVQDKADQDAADAVIAKIDAIGTVTLKSKKAIDAARKAYDKLTAAQQARVSNYAALTAAETTYAKLVQDKADQDAADAAIAKINAIGVVSRAAKRRIDAARKAYDGLTDAQKALVPASVVKTLTDAETAYSNLPPRHSSDDTADSTKPAQSSRTGDAGIAIYAAMSLLSVTGGAWVIGKKRKH